MAEKQPYIFERPAFVLAVIISALIAAKQLILFWLNDGYGCDFAVYWRVATGTFSDAYLPSEHWPFAYPPTMIAWVEPLAWAPFWPAYFLFAAAGALALFLACRRHRLPPPAIALVFFSPPLISTWFTGQVTAMLTAGLLWACATSNRLAAGIALGLIASVKPQFVIMAPLALLLARDWRALIAAGATFASTIAASVIAFGLDTWLVWLASLDDLHRVLIRDNVLQFAVTPAAAAEYWGLSPIPFLILGSVAGAYLVFKTRGKPPLVIASAIGCGSLLAAPYGLINDLAVVAPFLAWAVLQGRLMPTVALSAMLAPLPLLITACTLVRPRPLADQPEGDARHRVKGRRAAVFGEAEVEVGGSR